MKAVNFIICSLLFSKFNGFLLCNLPLFLQTNFSAIIMRQNRIIAVQMWKESFVFIAS